MNISVKEDTLIPSIWEEDEDLFEIIEDPSTTEAVLLLDCDLAEAHVEKSKARTAVLAQEAESNILELQRLLGKTSSGTATRNERDQLLSLNSKLSVLKKDIEYAKIVEEESELKLLRSRARSKVIEVKLAVKENDILRTLHAVQSAESVDIAFIIDCTDSMSPYIASVKDSIQDIIERVRATNNNLSLRLAIVGYRDINDHHLRFEVLDFVTSIDEFKSFLEGLSAIGGADTPEDMAGAIKEANNLSWSNPSKVAFLIADSPCHGSEFHSYDDSYPDGTPGICIIDELEQLQMLGPQNTMTITFGRITEQTDYMIECFREYGIPVDQVGIEEASALTETVTASVRKSIFKTSSATGAGKSGLSVAFAPIVSIDKLLGTGHKSTKSLASLKDYTISPKLPSSIDWKLQPYSVVKVYRNARINSIADLQNPLKMGVLRFLPAVLGKAQRTDETSESTMLMRRAPSPFAEGGIRLAYHGQLAQEVAGLAGSSMVMKSFKHIGKGVNNRDQYLKQMEVSAIANFLASEYNRSSYKPSYCLEINVLPVLVVEEVDETNESSGNRRFCTEHLLPTRGTAFTKFSNNTGYWNADTMDETLLRFTKYTHDVTDGYIIVTDLQGVRSRNAYHLTDPVILCKDILRFGNTNLGEIFIKKCIDSTISHLIEKCWTIVEE
jgi:hypothetical protein